VKRRLDSVEQSADAERHVMNHAVDEEPGRAAHTARKPALKVLADPLQVDVVVHLGRVQRHVQSKLLRVAVELLLFQPVLMREQQIVHLPEFALRTRALGSFRGQQRVGVNVFQREVPVREAHALIESLQEQLDRGRRLFAVGAFEVTVLDDRDGCMVRSERVIRRADRFGQLKGVALIHGRPIVASRMPLAKRPVDRDTVLLIMLELVIDQRRRDLGGFEVGRVLPVAQRRMVGPFIFFDHIGPVNFPAGIPKTVDVRPHPHIGLSTVTYLFDGEIMHRDSLGFEQPIHPAEVNWMTAGRGITHSERFEKARAQGDLMHGIQSWVALPDAEEETDPAFTHYGSGDLPVSEEGAVRTRLLAGEAFGAKAGVKTHSPLFYAHWDLGAGARVKLPAEYTERAAYVVAGSVEVGGHTYGTGQMLVFTKGADAVLKATSPSIVMALGGEPVGPRFIDWNFVSSSKERIEQAKADWRAGRMKLPDLDAREFIPLPASPPPPPTPPL
jgi:redox-sensitive bicupin YhaK (pirin superfamily)